MIGQILVVLERGIVPDVAAMGGTLGELQRECERLKVRSLVQQLERIKEHFISGTATPATMRPMVVALYDRMRDEFEDRFFLLIPTETIDFYRSKDPLFGKAVENKFPQMSEDISEAGKCLALNRSTAAVFHLMRVMEIAVQKLGDKLGVALASEKVWQKILNDINGAIKRMDQQASLTKAYAATASHLYNVKLAWRNEVMHPKQTYTPEEARKVLIRSILSSAISSV